MRYIVYYVAVKGAEPRQWYIFGLNSATPTAEHLPMPSLCPPYALPMPCLCPTFGGWRLETLLMQANVRRAFGLPIVACCHKNRSFQKETYCGVGVSRGVQSWVSATQSIEVTADAFVIGVITTIYNGDNGDNGLNMMIGVHWGPSSGTNFDLGIFFQQDLAITGIHGFFGRELASTGALPAGTSHHGHLRFFFAREPATTGNLPDGSSHHGNPRDFL